MKKFLVSAFAIATTVLCLGTAMAAATLTSVRGEVRSAVDQRSGPAAQNDRIESGWTVTTGPNSQAVLRFDDGQQVVLNQNTEFKITEFRYNEANPGNDRSAFEMLKGALRMLTGAIGKRNPNAFALRIPQATIGVRGTAFMVALVDQAAFLNVTEGAIAASNAAGTAAFGAGSLGSVASSTALATSISAGALPAAASGAFSSMSSVTLSAVGAGAGGAAGGAAGTAGAAVGAAVPAGAVAAGAVGAAAAAASGGGGNTTTTHH